MKFQLINFENNSSKRIYSSYISRVKKTVSPLNIKDQDDILMEINSHIYEGLKSEIKLNEIEALINTLEKLGDPEVVLKPLVADKKLEQATKTLNPIHVFRALVLNISNGVSYVLFSILYLSLLGFVFLIYSKITMPKVTGLYFEEGSFLVLGKYNSKYLNQSQIQEILGTWFIPVMLLCIIVLYLFITLIIKLKRKINKK
jgi:hypothetical protein